VFGVMAVLHRGDFWKIVSVCSLLLTVGGCVVKEEEDSGESEEVYEHYFKNVRI
jgi:hypothetical protein